MHIPTSRRTWTCTRTHARRRDEPVRPDTRTPGRNVLWTGLWWSDRTASWRGKPEAFRRRGRKEYCAADGRRQTVACVRGMEAAERGARNRQPGLPWLHLVVCRSGPWIRWVAPSAVYAAATRRVALSMRRRRIRERWNCSSTIAQCRHRGRRWRLDVSTAVNRSMSRPGGTAAQPAAGAPDRVMSHQRNGYIGAATLETVTSRRTTRAIGASRIIRAPSRVCPEFVGLAW